MLGSTRIILATVMARLCLVPTAVKTLSATSDSHGLDAKVQQRVADLVDRFRKTGGYEAVFFKGCLEFVGSQSNNSIPVVRQIEHLGDACRAGLLIPSQQSLLAKKGVKPNQLAAECDHAVRALDIQVKVLGPQSLATPENFCAIFVDVVLPIDDEPECLRFVEDVTHTHLEFLGAKHSWPDIIQQHHFDEAFMRVCLDDEQLQEESRGHSVDWGAGSTPCSQRLHEVMQISGVKYQGLAHFLAVLCPIVGKPLPVPKSTWHETDASTTRSMQVALFRRAAQVQHGANAGPIPTPRQQEVLNYSLSSLNDSVQRKGGNSVATDFLRDITNAREARRLSVAELRCCSEEAKTYNAGIEASAVYAESRNFGPVAYGFNAWKKNPHNGKDHDCEYKEGPITEKCQSLGVDVGGDFSIYHGIFFTYDDILGKSNFIGAEACYVACFGGSRITNPKGKHIGYTIEFGFGMGFDGAIGTCDCEPIGEPVRKVFPNLYWDCPAHRSQNCFPADSLVETPSGKVRMQELRAGDRALAVDPEGFPFFDEIYFFGHADGSAVSFFLSFTVHVEDWEFQLDMSPDHFLLKCPGEASCVWSDAEAIYASKVDIGAYVWTARGESLQQGQIVSITASAKTGLYNPYSLKGTIVVNGVVASVHSSWVLDAYMPEHLAKYLPSIYQLLFFPGRLLYRICGPSAATSLDLNNPQPTSSRTDHFGLTRMISAVAGGLTIVVLRHPQKASALLAAAFVGVLQGCEEATYNSVDEGIAALCHSNCPEFCKSCVRSRFTDRVGENPVPHNWINYCGRNAKTCPEPWN